MKKTFSNWDFNSNWSIDEGNTYPYLKWQKRQDMSNEYALQTATYKYDTISQPIVFAKQAANILVDSINTDITFNATSINTGNVFIYPSTFPKANATYHGTIFSISQSGIVAPYTIDIARKDIKKETPTVKLASYPSSSTVDKAIGLTATISGGKNPTGTVTFKINNTQINTPITISGGKATTNYTPTTAGEFSFSAVYNGDVNNEPAKSEAIKVTVNVKSTPNSGSGGGGGTSSGSTSTSKENKSMYPSSVGDASGWRKDETGWWLVTGQNTYAKSEWKLIEKSWYFFNDKGYMVSGWVLLINQWYYLQNSGAMITGWLLNNSKWYYLNSSGINGNRMDFN